MVTKKPAMGHMRAAWVVPSKPDRRGKRIPVRAQIVKTPLGLFAVPNGSTEGKLVLEAAVYDEEVDAMNALDKGERMWLLDEGQDWRSDPPTIEEVTAFPSYNEYSRRRGHSIALTPVADKEGHIRTLSPQKRGDLFRTKRDALARIGETIEKKILDAEDTIKSRKRDLLDAEEELSELKHWRGLCRRAKVEIKSKSPTKKKAKKKHVRRRR